MTDRQETETQEPELRPEDLVQLLKADTTVLEASRGEETGRALVIVVKGRPNFTTDDTETALVVTSGLAVDLAADLIAAGIQAWGVGWSRALDKAIAAQVGAVSVPLKDAIGDELARRRGGAHGS